jgi:LmbE family N-acetylglucosaminyl deacetylase
MNILAIGAHPDDIELGCGGMLIKCAKKNHKVYMYALTRGGASGDAEQRTHELEESARFIGAEDLWIDDFQDTKLAVTDELINHIEHIINKAEADVIFTHSHGDVHHDHRAIALATIEAGRFISNILSYEIPLTKNFAPQVFFDVSDVIDKKVKLIEIFWSQQSKLYLKANAIRGLAEYRALQSRLNTTINYVEAYEVLKLCLNTEFSLNPIPHENLPKISRIDPSFQQIMQLSELI